MRHRRREPRTMVSDPFRLAALPAPLRWPIERALGMTTLGRLYDELQQSPRRSPDPFERRVLRALGIRLHVTQSDLAPIPSRGPVVIAANHPHGAVDGPLLLELVRRVRPDVRLLAN